MSVRSGVRTSERCWSEWQREYERPIDPVFRADSVVLAISVEKDGNLRVVYARIFGEVLKLVARALPHRVSARPAGGATHRRVRPGHDGHDRGTVSFRH
jgi:hypothetical protein